MKFAASLLKLLAAMRASPAPVRSEVAVLPAPLIVALEPRIVYDASAAFIGAAAVAAQHHADADAHTVSAARETTLAPAEANSATGAQANASSLGVVGARHGYTTTPPTGGAGDTAAVRAVHGYTDAVVQTADKQVVFIESNVTDYQTLVAGLPAGTQYVILDSTKDGLAQIAQYLQQHSGVSAIHLVSHGADGEIQIGNTWLNEGNLSAYSAELAQIGAAMKPGGDFLIYGCDVAQQADGQLLVQQIASITHLDVAASTHLVGAAALGGSWALNYDVGNVTTPIVFSQAGEAKYGDLLAQTVESYDAYANGGNGEVIASYVSSFTLDGITYTTDGAVQTGVYTSDQGSPLSVAPADGVLMINQPGDTPMTKVTISLSDGDMLAVQGFDFDEGLSTGTIWILPNGSTSGEIELSGSQLSGHVDLSSYSQFKGVSSITILDVNDAGYFTPTLNNFTYTDLSSPPTLTASGGSSSFVAADNATSTPIAVDSGITLVDGDSSTAVSATVAITGNFHSSEDVLAFANTSSTTYGNISASYNPATGRLTLTSASGTATIAQWQAALQAVTYTDTAITPNAATRTISFQISSDGYTGGNIAGKTVTVTDTDQTPIVTTAGGTTTYQIGTSAATIDGSITVTDRDNGTQSSATVRITGDFQSGDTLSFSNTSATSYGNIAVQSYDPSTGVLTLQSAGSTATDAQWANALSSVTFYSTSLVAGTRTISFETNDGTKNSAAATDFVNATSPVRVTTDSGSAAFVAGDNTSSTPVAVDSGLAVSDTATNTLASATVAITGGFQSGQDVLAFTNDGSTMGNIVGSYNAATGVLTLTSAGSSATLGQWQSALRSVAYTDTAVTPDSTTRTVSFSIVDSLSNTSTAATRTVTVTDTDQSPIVTTTGGTTNYVRGTAAATIDGGVSVSDLDNTTQSSGAVSVSGGFHSGDTLTFVNTNSTTFGNIVGSYNSATGVLTLTSSGATATDSQWANALSSVTFSSTSAVYGNRTISFSTSDGTKTSTAATDTINMTAPPNITTDSGSASFVSGDNAASTPVAIDPGLTVTDGSATTLASTTVAITGGFRSGQDVLAFTNDGTTMGNIASSYNAATGVMTLTSAGASATLAQWQSALQSITYTDAQAIPDTTTRTISFTAVDGAGNASATATRTVTVTATDQSPIVTTTGGTTNYVGGTTAATIDGGISVNDLDNTTQSSATISVATGFRSGDTLTFVNTNATTFGNIVGSYNSATGVLTLTSSGATATDAQWGNALSAVTFSASSSATPGNRTISFMTSDGTKNSAVATDAVDVLGPPTITTDSGSASFVAADNAVSTPVAIDPGLSLSDGISPTLASTTIAITGSFHPGEDVLAFTNTSAATYGNIAASYNAATGVLTLTSSGASATLAQWQAALDAVTYTDTAVTPSSGTRTIGFTAVDTGAFTSNTATRTVTVSDTDQTPIVTTTGGTTNYVVGAAGATIDRGVSVSDRDNATQSSATVSISGNFSSGEDALAFTNGNAATFGNIAGAYNSATGVLTLTSAGSTATDAQWANALSAVTFSTSGTHFGNRTISFATSDGIKTSALATDTVAVLDRPHIALDPGSASFSAADNATSTPVAVAPGLTLTDASSGTFSATVSITGGLHSDQDVLALTKNNATMGDIIATYDANTGVLTLTSPGGTATRDDWQTALAAVTYTNTAITPDTTTRAISFAVTDGNGEASDVQTRSLIVTDTDQTPLLAVSGGVTFASRGTASTPALVAPQVTLSDRDNGTLTWAQVTISGGFDAANDTLAFAGTAATGNISASYNAATGVLTLNSAGSSATLGQWEAALRAVTYSDSAPGATGSRTVTFTVSDGVKTSATASNTITIVRGQTTIVPILPSAPPPAIDMTGSPPSSAITDIDNTVPPDVLDELDQPMPIGSVRVVQTMTFTDPNAPENMHSLDRAAVSNVDMTEFNAAIGATPIDAPIDAPIPLPDVSFTLEPNDPFSISVATLLPLSEAMNGGADVTVRLADGHALPPWIRYDAANGVLRGKLPPGVGDVRIVVRTRDASGHETRREIVLAPHDNPGGSHGALHPKQQGHAARSLIEPAAARAARPVGKPSLDQQFAQARSALHVSHSGGAARRV